MVGWGFLVILSWVWTDCGRIWELSKEELDSELPEEPEDEESELVSLRVSESVCE